MSQFNVIKNDTNPDQVYYDVTVTNFQSTTTQPPIFYYNEQRTMPFVSVPEDYYLSILRFTVDTGTLPVFIPSIQPNQGNRNLTIYSVTLSYFLASTGVTYVAQEFLDWTPQDLSAPIPVPPNGSQTGTQVNDTGYYNCYSYTFFLGIVGRAFEQAFTSLSAQVVTAGGVLPSAEPPYIDWDTSSSSGTLFADALGYDVNPSAGYTPILVYMNAPLYSLFESFPARYLGYELTPLNIQGRNFQLLPFNKGSTNLQVITPVNGDPVWTAICLYQECSTTSAWTPIQSLVFISNTLPINPNQVSTPLIFNNGAQLGLGGNNSAIANVITDLVSDTGSYRPNLVYTPTAQYRYITLYGNRPLFNIDLEIFYRLRTGQLIPFRLQSGGTVTVKIAFIKKDSCGKSSSQNSKM
jgi:hypothetical protein